MNLPNQIVIKFDDLICKRKKMKKKINRPEKRGKCLVNLR